MKTLMLFMLSCLTLLAQDPVIYTIDLATFDASAVGGSDYMGSQGSVTIKAGSTSAYYIKDDETDEGNESFYLAPTGYTVADNFEREVE